MILSFSDTHLKHLSHQSRSGINEKFTLTVVLGLLLTVFLVLCLGLIIYICKDRTKRKNSPSPSFESEQHQQMVSSSMVWYFPILLPKLFWPTLRKKSSSDREKLLKFEAEGRESAKILRSLEQFIQTVKGQNNFW